ncbi:MAG TPA: hypothetical protein VK631_18360 [Solirubrobacteraceae bacterium]|nr:hypothetical protein [Solirubrobacteraceae bacterium]
MGDEDEALSTDEANDLANEAIAAMTSLVNSGYNRADLMNLVDAAMGNAQ